MTQPTKELIPRAVMGIGKDEIALTLKPRGMMVGRPFMLERDRPIYLIFN